ncbi:glycosyltransferase family 39 protein [Pseudonocardia sp. GCM10023141]|uniref:glycosyltransferase family 39 protein n=1 Tax=Pseudonocardia sp. GCM10023141 TaxID=3252653 RepID=UPI0036098331
MTALATPSPTRAGLPDWRRGPAFVIALAGLAVHLAFAAGYGYHRDELYFLAESKRMAWGFASEPPFTPAVGWVSRALFGDALIGLRLWPALAGAAFVLLATLVARELGGRLTAQLTAGICVGTATMWLALFHLYGPSAFDQVAWAGCLLVLVKLLRGADQRWWLAFGAIAGVGLLNKNTLVLLALGLVPALLLSRTQRHLLRSPYLWLGGVLAVAVASPFLLWQAAHDWPMVAVAATISHDFGGPVGALTYLPMQVLTMNPLLLPVWVAGLWWLLRSPGWRPIGSVYLLLLVLLAVIGGRSYYLAPMYLPLFAAGGIGIERWLARPGVRLRARVVPVVLVAVAVITSPMALPVLPLALQRDLPFTSINPVLGDAIGWPQFVAQLAAVRDGLPAAERAGVMVLAANYGEAGAVEALGGPYGLGQPVSGHNNYWQWGPPPAGTDTVIAVGFRDSGALQRVFGDVRRAGTVDNGPGIDNEEQGLPIWICRYPVAPWAQLWPGFQHNTN